jgi:hypothetical protein
MYIRKCLSFTVINIARYCKEKDLEACAIKLKLLSKSICIVTEYRSPSGNFQLFLNGLDNNIKKVYKSYVHLIICGDININYFNDYKEKRELNNILKTYNLVSIIHFPTKITNKSRTIIDNIFLDTTKIINFETHSLPNGLSDHEAQMLEIYSHILKCNKSNYKVKTIGKVDLYSIKEFKDKLSEELWQNIFDIINGDVNSNFNSFLNTYLLIFYSFFVE